MKVHGILSFGVGLALTALLPGTPALAAPPGTTIIDGSQTYQLIEGFGANANHRSWNNTELQPALDALIDQAGLTIFRIIFDKTDWESANDNTDPNVFNWTYYSQLYTNSDFQKQWDMVAWLNQMGLSNSLMFNFQGVGPPWMGGNTLTSGLESEWAEMIASLLIYARNTRQLQFALVSPGNENDNNPPQGIVLTSAQYVTALRRIAQLLDANGLGDLRFVGPDLAHTSSNRLTDMFNDSLVMAKLAHFGLHSYEDNGGGSAGIYDFLRQSAYPDRTFWMTEYNYWCSPCEQGSGGDNTWLYARTSLSYLLYHLANGASAGLIWEAYDSQYNYYNPGQWSYWGLLGVDDISATPKTYTPRKTFYTLAQIAKFVRPGARRIRLSGFNPVPQMLAFHHPGTGQLIITGINPYGSSPIPYCLLTNLPAVTNLSLYYTSATTNLCYGASVPVSNNAFSATIPADCVFTFVSSNSSVSSVSVLLTNPLNGSFYTAPATIPVGASASTTAGTISQVVFFCGTTNLGEATSSPYSVTWSNVPPGVYGLSARATNSLGSYAVSPAINVTVIGPAAQINVSPTNATVAPYATQQFTATAVDALGTPLVPQPSFSWSASGGGTINTNGLYTAGGSVGGPFAITAGTDVLAGVASVSVTTNLNLAPAGLGYTWYTMSAITGDSPRAAAPGINDGDLNTDVHLHPTAAVDDPNAYEAAGVVWAAPQTIGRVTYGNGSYTVDYNGVFAAAFGLQFSPDGTTWTNAAAWTVVPPYTYNSPSSANVTFTFTGGVATVRGVRCVGRVHTDETSQNSWIAFATEVQAFAPPTLPPAVLSAIATSANVVISWPAALTNYFLEANTNLLATNSWSPVTNTPQTVGDLRTVTLPAVAERRFFRLHQQ